MADPGRLVSLADLKDLVTPGMVLPFRLVDGQGRLLLNAGQAVHDERQWQLLVERGASADADEVQALRGTPAATEDAPNTQTWFARMERRLWTLDDLLRGLGRGSTTAAALLDFADELIALVDRHPDAALFLCVRQEDRRFALYPLKHAQHAATVALLTARQLGWAEARIRSLVGAALTMNAAIVELQGRLAEQADPPSKRQRDQIRAHPEASRALLQDAGVGDTDWLQAVQDHHERADGGGYPRGEAAVGEMARLLRAADQFSAKLSPRALRAPLLPQLAARQLFEEEQGGALAAALIKAVGIYPPGDLVRLKSGEVGVVMQRASAGSAAQVTVLLSPAGRPPHEPLRRDTAQPEFAITGPLGERSAVPRLLPEQVYGLLLP